MQRVLSKEETRSDLDRVRASNAASVVGVFPTNLKIVKEKYMSGLSKLKYFKPETLEIDAIVNAAKIILQDEILLRPDLQPVRYVTLQFIIQLDQLP